MARKWALLGLAITGLIPVGCGGFDTPRTLRGSPRPDRPDLPTAEQERRGRARYGIIEDDFRVGPRTYVDRPDPVAGGIGGRGAGAP